MTVQQKGKLMSNVKAQSSNRIQNPSYQKGFDIWSFVINFTFGF
jgi:hypothetical protein